MQMIWTAKDKLVATFEVTLQIPTRSVGKMAGDKLGAATSAPS